MLSWCLRSIRLLTCWPFTYAYCRGVALLGLFIVLYLFHLRRKRNDEREWPKDPQELDDYGFGSDSAGGVKPPKNTYSGSTPGNKNNSNNNAENPFGNTAEVMGGREQPMGRY